MFTMNDTILHMTSDDYRNRFWSEYWQTKIRYEKLKDFCNRIEAAQIFDTGTIVEEPKHDCPLHMLRDQQKAMGQYLHILELRAVIEKIDLAKEPDL